jgi:murein DD-endopeptidase MepM/ murein hydrolase activator NlpD
LSHKKKYLAVFALALIGVTLAVVSYLVSPSQVADTPIGSNLPHSIPIEQTVDGLETEAQGEAQITESSKYVREATIGRGATFSHVLSTQLDFSAAQIHRLTEVVRPLMNLRKIDAGTKVKTTFVESTDPTGEVVAEPVRVTMKISDRKTLIVTNLNEESPNAVIEDAVITSSTRAYSGEVNHSLWASAANAGMDPAIITSMAEIFAWQIDFNREVRANDRWRLVVEEVFANGKPIGYGDIVSAEYINAGFNYVAVKYEMDDRTQYFQPDGNSLKRMFLKSPLKFGRITSGFQARRFHPVLKVTRPHLGVDYGAPTGTPVMSVGDGVVSFAGTRGGSGKMITIRHNAVYRTEYKHLSRYSENIRPGARVSMGQTIGYVGATGLATGPHLHFEFHEGNSVVDPQGMKFPTADPVPANLMADFQAKATAAIAQMPPWSALVLTKQDDGGKPEGVTADSAAPVVR